VFVWYLREEKLCTVAVIATAHGGLNRQQLTAFSRGIRGQPYLTSKSASFLRTDTFFSCTYFGSPSLP
jgi:hypothetical protein